MGPQVSGILESSVYVDDIDRSVEFYTRLFGFDTLTRGKRICALSVSDRQVFLIFQKGGSTDPTEFPGGVIPPTDGDGELHVAFSVTGEELEEWRKWLGENEIEIESAVKWGRGGRSIYIRDPDNHLIELVTPGCWAIY